MFKHTHFVPARGRNHIDHLSHILRAASVARRRYDLPSPRDRLHKFRVRLDRLSTAARA